MRRRTIGLLLILSLVLIVGGTVLVEVVFSNSSSVYNPDTGSNVITRISSVPLLITGIVLFVAGMASVVVAWIAALVNLARLQQWTWFILMMFFSWVCLIVYVFAGPEAPGVRKAQAYPQPHQDLAFVPPVQAQAELQLELPPQQ